MIWPLVVKAYLAISLVLILSAVESFFLDICRGAFWLGIDSSGGRNYLMEVTHLNITVL